MAARTPRALRVIATTALLLSACGQAQSTGLTDEVAAASATPGCQGTVSPKHGYCYDFAWCVTNWGNLLEAVAKQASGEDSVVDWIAESVDFVEDELPPRETEMGLRSIQSVVTTSTADGAARGALEANSRARADCGDSGFFEAQLAFQLRFIG